jgi:hypothetical protein
MHCKGKKKGKTQVKSYSMTKKKATKKPFKPCSKCKMPAKCKRAGKCLLHKH